MIALVPTRTTVPSQLERPPGQTIPPEWREEFEAAARRPLRLRFRYAFVHTYKPVLDDAPFRAFDTTAEYRRWCEENLPDWLGYGRVRVPGAILLGFPDTTQDADVFVEKTPANGRAIVRALRDLGFALDQDRAEQIERCKGFVQLRNGPFDLDLVFAPDGIEGFDDAWRRRVEVEGFPVCHIDDIIASKEASGRVKDRESLPRLRSFRMWWLEQRGGRG